MAEYTVVAKVVKIEKADKEVFIYVKGVGKYAYEKDKDNKWSILECQEPDLSKFDGCNVKCSIGNDNNILKDVVVAAMINNKPLKLTVTQEHPSSENQSSNDKKPPYIITAVEMP